MSESDSDLMCISGQSLILSVKSIEKCSQAINSQNKSFESSIESYENSYENSISITEPFASEMKSYTGNEEDVLVNISKGTTEQEDELETNKSPVSATHLENLILEITPEDISNLKPHLLLELSEKWGRALNYRIHYQASLESGSYATESVKNPVHALRAKSDDIKPVISALISLTGKGFTDDPDCAKDYKLGSYVLTAIEALLKASNNNCIPAFSSERTMQQAVSHGPKVFLPQNIGGSRKHFEDNLPLEPIPMEPSGILASDNTQRNIDETQHFGRMGVGRKPKHEILTHNVRFILPDDETSTDKVLQMEDVMPKHTIMNCALRPMCGLEDIFFERLEKDVTYGKEMIRTFLGEILDEVLQQRAAGNGHTAMERELLDQQAGTANEKFYCPRCPSSQDYIALEATVCKNCGFNASFYPIDENPYRQSSFPKGPHVQARWVEQEPQKLNPGTKNDLHQLLEEHKTYWKEKHRNRPLTGDALPTMTSAKEQSDSVICEEHEEIVALSDTKALRNHLHCKVSIPHDEVHFIAGESHEELKMNRTALSINWNIGLPEFLQALGRQTKQSQMAATKSGKLVNLFPITKCFTLGTLQALCSIYVKNSAILGNIPTVSGWIKYTKESKDLLYVARMKMMMDVNIPVLLKRDAIRNNNPKLADAATALFAPILFVTPGTYYREYVKHKYTNGSFVPGQLNRSSKPKSLLNFLENLSDTSPDDMGKEVSPEMGDDDSTDDLLDLIDNDNSVEAKKVKTPVTNVPTEHKEYTKWKNEHRFITFSSKPGEAEGVDFKQEAIINRVNKNMARGQMFDINVLRKASRLTYNRSCVGQNQTTTRRNPHCRYAQEIRKAGTLVLRQAEDPGTENGLGHLDVDVLRLRKLGMINMKEWISLRYKAVPGGKIRLKKVAITCDQKVAQEKVENLTKAEIIEKIKEFPLSKNELEIVKKKTITHTTLVDLYHEVEDRLTAENAAFAFSGSIENEGTDAQC